MTDQPVETMAPPGTGSGRWSAFLSGIGYYRLSVRRRKILSIVFGASLAVHIVGLMVAGVWAITHSPSEEVTIFTTPPPVRTYEPRKLEHRVKVKKRQRSSSRPSMVPRLVSTKLSDVALPEIKVDPKLIHTTFQPNFKAVSGKGLGAGLGTGYGTHGFGQGVSSINFFGIQAKGERVAVLVDVSVSMVEEERGGVLGYMQVKKRLGQVVDALSEASLFNVVVFADAANVMEKKMVIGSPDNKRRAKTFIQPYNMEGNWGLSSGNVSASYVGLQAKGGTTRLDLALTEAIRQGADTILVISDGIPRVKKGHTAEQMAAHAETLSAWQSSAAASAPSAPVSSKKVWIPPQPARPARPARPASKAPPKAGHPRCPRCRRSRGTGGWSPPAAADPRRRGCPTPVTGRWLTSSST